MNLIDLIFPQTAKCLFCGNEDGGFGLCDDCLKTLPFVKGNTCQKCGIEISSGHICIECKNSNHIFEKCYSIFLYSGRVRSEIVSLKQNKRKVVAKVFGHIVSEYISKLNIDFDIVVPIPIHENRLKERGFNQSGLLLNEYSQKSGKVQTDILFRIKDTPHQTGLDKAHRESNLSGAFKVSKAKVKNKTILLFDDIFTTGATLDECARVLQKAGAKKVFALCLARTPISTNKILDKSFDINFDII